MAWLDTFLIIFYYNIHPRQPLPFFIGLHVRALIITLILYHCISLSTKVCLTDRDGTCIHTGSRSYAPV